MVRRRRTRVRAEIHVQHAVPQMDKVELIVSRSTKNIISHIIPSGGVSMKIRPFRDGDTFTTFQKHIEDVTREIQSLDNEYVLKASQTELEDYFIDKASANPLVLHTDEYYIENRSDVQVEVQGFFLGERATVQGTCLDIAIPYEGDRILWQIRPSTFSLSGYPEIDLRESSIMLSISFPDNAADAGRIKSEIDRQIQSLVDAVQNLGKDVDRHNLSVPDTVKSALQRKRQLAEAAIGTIAALGIPIKRQDTPPTFTAPTIRRSTPVKRPKVDTQAYKPEPVLDNNEYEHILEVMRSMALVIERSPASFATLDEEAIRTHFLLQLNGHYEGGATGETFNASGKTDILIRVENRNIFVAECKFWRGTKAFSEAVDQLLSYLTWRDTKSALLIFNRTRDAAGVRQKMHEVMTSRPEYRRTISHNPNEDSRYVFVKDSDQGREIIITTQLYDIPVAAK